MTDADLMDHARRIRAVAYAPYSGFFVGAAIEDEAGRVHFGCNVENAAYPQGSCAEANAIGAMAAAGGRRVVRIAIAGGRDVIQDCMPCGGCRQRIREFSTSATVILVNGPDGRPIPHRIDDLLPFSFDASDLAGGAV